ncbi:MAG: polysaccharide biosynthesis/export family protein [Polymorphobacter sp.]|uniref:polysaccharide biosynthesis/export family protein n=1 Tax=Polymorphobacter sp. TaxID=1909290 RepID=UPI003A887E2D
MRQLRTGFSVFSSFFLTIALLVLSLPAMAQTNAPASGSRGYVIGPNDGVQIIIYGQPEAGVTTRVKADGTIVMPFLGKLKVDGLDNIQLADLIERQMVAGDFLRQPLVNVEITQYVSKTVNVAGAVTKPQILPLDRPYHVLEVLLQSGWTRADSADYIYLRRPSQTERRLSVEGLVRGDTSENPLVMPEDTLFVPTSDKFYISGAIASPGVYPIVPGMTIEQAIVTAGGVGANGSKGKVGLIRGGQETSVETTEKLQRDDLIVVKERFF